MKSIFGYISSVRLELKKVSWSSKQELIGSTIVVFMFAVILGLFLWVLDDLTLSKLANFIYTGSFFEAVE